MKFTLDWLGEHLDHDADLATVLDTLTRIGLEVEGVANPGDRLAAFTIARVISAEPHPKADKLQLLRVDTGAGDPVQVVCGAPNAREGLVGVFAAPGTHVPGIDLTLKVAEIRGIESRGMMCSQRELELSDEHEGIIELPADAPVGEGYAHWARLDDPVIDVAITPNRQDCMGVRGIARDLAAAGLGTLKPLAQVYRMPDDSVAMEGAGPDVRTDDPEGCPAFFGQEVRGVTNGVSPPWMTRCLTAIGQKPISALVDITNFVMLDLGRPLHVYDKAKLSGGLVARKARTGEQVLALNGKIYTLDETMTVIADDARVHDIGGIMGGADSGVSETTTDVLIECAYFAPEHIARTGQKLLLTSDARQRFERGVDPVFLDEGLAIATWLVVEHCGGTASGVTRAGEPPVAARTIAYDPALAGKLGGLDPPADEQRAMLERLGFAVTGDGPFSVTVPTWRRDIDGAPDIVEEVLRIAGYDNIPSTPLERAPGVARPTATPAQKTERKVRRAAAARGLNEAMTWSFLSEREAAVVGAPAWLLANPISEEMKAMRASLIPGLAAAARRNLDRGAASTRLFEIGRRYLAEGERRTLGVVLAGQRGERQWGKGAATRFDAFDAKAEALALLDAAGAPVDKLQLLGDAAGFYHPGRSGRLGLGPKNILAEFGELHPATLKALYLDAPAMAAEIFLDAIPEKRVSGHMREAFAPPVLQPVKRDFAFVVDAGLAAGDLVRAVKSSDKAAIVDARLFDVFTGEAVDEGRKSLAIEVTLQPGAKSFSEEELKGISAKIVAAAAKLGAELRG